MAATTNDSGAVGRWLTVAAVLACLGPPLTVALIGLGMSLVAAVAAPVLIAAAIAGFHSGVPAMPIADARRHPVLAILWTCVLVAGSWQTVRASLYANDVRLVRHSVVPGDRFRVEHCCFTAYAEAARLAAEHRPVYDPEAYLPGGQRRRIGPLTVDPYHYPPPFLFIPAAVRLVAPDFFASRRVWFGLQALALGGAMLAVAWWIGGATGRRIGLLSAVVWATPHTFMALQTGNFQTTAVAAALVGCLMARSSSAMAGGSLLALAAGAKIFPGVLLVHALMWNRRGLTTAIAVSGIALVLASAAVFGVDTYVQFFRDELPRMLSGASFPQTELVGTAPVNSSFYGLTTKLRVAGMTWFDQVSGRRLAQIYTLLLVVFALCSGWILRRYRDFAGSTGIDEQDRLGLAMLWLAILNLAAFISPFVGVAYGTYGTVWLAVLLLGAARPVERWVAAIAFAFVTVPTMLVPSGTQAMQPTTAAIVTSLVGQFTALTVNAWVAWRWFAAMPARHGGSR